MHNSFKMPKKISCESDLSLWRPPLFLQMMRRSWWSLPVVLRWQLCTVTLSEGCRTRASSPGAWARWSSWCAAATTSAWSSYGGWKNSLVLSSMADHLGSSWPFLCSSISWSQSINPIIHVLRRPNHSRLCNSPEHRGWQTWEWAVGGLFIACKKCCNCDAALVEVLTRETSFGKMQIKKKHTGIFRLASLLCKTACMLFFCFCTLKCI